MSATNFDNMAFDYDDLNEQAVKVATLCDDDGERREEVYAARLNNGETIYAWCYADPNDNDQPAFNSHYAPFVSLANAIASALEARDENARNDD